MKEAAFKSKIKNKILPLIKQNKTLENQVRRIIPQKSLVGYIDAWNGKSISGWYVTENRYEPVVLFCDGTKECEVKQNTIREDVFSAGISNKKNVGFFLLLDVNELRYRAVKNISIGANENFLVGSPTEIKSFQGKGNIDEINNNISGWIYDESYPEANIKFDLYINDVKKTTVCADLFREDLLFHNIVNSSCGFVVNIDEYLDSNEINKIDIKLYGTNEEIFPTRYYQSQNAKVSSLTKLQNILKKEILSNSDEGLKWLNKVVVANLIDDLRKGIGEYPLHEINQKKLDIKTKTIDVIIPVYKGIVETISCIKSIFQVRNNTKFDLIVINDSSPEPELTNLLRKLAKELAFTLLENQENLGFVQTVNRGMKHSSVNDVLLLNSDTIVTDGWLDKILTTAYSEPTIGTVTPFSNNATICSYPEFCADNQLPKTASLSELSQIVALNNGIVDLPTAHGFCMFIKRETLNEVGFFDDQKWGKGYAEENDFSLRAIRLGWRNVMATNAFVQHLGSVSFANDSKEFIAKNLQQLNAIYPDYAANVQDFIRKDPIRLYRNNIAIALMRKEVDEQINQVEIYEGSIVFVSLTIGGGTEVATNALSKLHLENCRSVFMLVSPKPNVWELKSLIDNAKALYHLPEDKEQLLLDLKTLHVSKFHIHHTLQFDQIIWDIPNELGVTYDVTLHDYYSICPRVNLIDETDSYCGEPSSTACNRCIRRNGVHNSSLFTFDKFGNDIDNWRNFFEEKLQKADKVITPSIDTKERILKYFDLNNIEAIYHPEPAIDYQPKSLESVEIINIGFIGAIGVHNGLNILKNCAEYAYKFDLPVKFTVIGYTSDDSYFDNLPNVSITGKYKYEELDDLIAKNDIHVAALFSVWPETYSYTLSEAMRNNLHIACFDLGAIPERNKNVLVCEQSASNILEQILENK